MVAAFYIILVLHEILLSKTLGLSFNFQLNMIFALKLHFSEAFILLLCEFICLFAVESL